MKVSFLQRDNVTPFLGLDLDVEVDRYSKEAVGGPKTAKITMRGEDRDLWQLINRVRCPIQIYTDKGEVAWWGYVDDVQATVLVPDRPQTGRVNIGVSIRDMFNSVAVAYAAIDITDGTKTRETTAYFTDDVSIAEFGSRELLWSPGAATAEHANAAGTAKLFQSRYPEPILTPAPDADESYAEVTGAGWWDTMSWQYYANAGTASLDTANQAGTIILNEGQFFEKLFLDVESGISLRETRDGDNTALYYLSQMMETGTTNFRRMLADVDPWRNIRLYEEPERPANPYLLQTDGSFLSPYGEPIRNELCPVAFWAFRSDIISSSFDAFLLADPSWVFVEGMEYVAAEDKLTHRARGDPDPWEFPVIHYG